MKGSNVVEMDMNSLRERLGELDRQDEFNFDSIEKIRGHSIQLVERHSLPGPLNFNCVAYALNLRADEFHNAIAASDYIVRASPSRSDDLSIFALLLDPNGVVPV